MKKLLINTENFGMGTNVNIYKRTTSYIFSIVFQLICLNCFCYNLPALIMLVSNLGNSFLASALQEYIEAPSSLTMVYITFIGLKNPALMSSVSHSSVSRQAVPFPRAIKVQLKTLNTKEIY